MSNASAKEEGLNDVDRIYFSAEAQLLQGNLNLAEEKYQEVLKLDPEHAPSYYALGVLNYQRGNINASIEMLKKSLGFNPDNANALNAYAVMLDATGNAGKALEYWDKAIAINADYFEAYTNKANCLKNLDRFEEALEAAQKAIDINPDFVEAYINKGNALNGLDRLDEMIETLSKAAEINPDMPNVFINLSNASRENGESKKAEEYAHKAIELAPNMPEGHNNLGNALSDLGNHYEAEKCYKRATNLRPEYYEAHNNHAIVCMSLLDYDQAQISARYAIAFNKEYAKAYSNLSVALREMGNLDEAKYAAQEAIRLEPESASFHIDLVDILFLEDRFEDAEVVLQRAMALKDDSPQMYLKLANVFDRTNKIEESIEAIEKAVELNPEMPEAYHRMALVYFHANRLEDAMIALEKAFDINENYLWAMATKAEILQSLDKMDEALSTVQHAISVHGEVPFLYYTLSKLKKFEKDDPDLKIMKDLAEDEERIGLEQVAALNFGLFSAYQNVKDYNAAFAALKRGNDAKRSLIPHSTTTQTETFNAVKKRFTPDFVSNLSGNGCDSDLPVFILGMPRSGSTLTEQILASHPDVFGAGELHELAMVEQEHGGLNAKNCKQYGQDYCDLIRKHDPDAKRITDKMPGNFMRIGHILMTMPNAKIIHTKRDPVDTCLSCYKQLFARGQYWSYDLEDLAEYYKQYLSMMEHWHNLFPGQIYDIDYEKTVSDTENEARALIDFVGLDWNEACLTPHKTKRPILTASKAQVVKPIYQTSVKAWERYEEQLQPLIQALKS